MKDNNGWGLALEQQQVLKYHAVRRIIMLAVLPYLFIALLRIRHPRHKGVPGVAGMVPRRLVLVAAV